MSANSNKIERIAVHTIERYFEGSNLISTYINEGDKEPVWDGHLYLYSGVEDNDHLVGRVPVQSKGRVVKDTDADEISYPVEVVNLKNYLKDGGVLYFVVLEKDELKRIFYSALSPVALKDILGKCKGEQKTKNIKLVPLPDKLLEAEKVVNQFYIDCKQQKAVPNINPLSIEQWVKQDKPAFSVEIVFDKSKNSLTELTRNPQYIYGIIDQELNIKVPIGTGKAQLTLQHTVQEPVKVGGHVHYDSYDSTFDHGLEIISIGKSLTITKDEDLHLLNFKVTWEPKMLNDAVRDGEFLLDFFRNRSLTIGDLTRNLPSAPEDFSPSLSRMLPHLKDLQMTLHKLQCHDDIRIGESISEKDERNLQNIVRMVGKGDEMALGFKQNTLITLTVSNLTLGLLAVKTKTGKFRMSSLFDPSLKMKVCAEYEDGKFETAYLLTLSSEDYHKFDNIPLDRIVSELERINPINPHTLGDALVTCMNLLFAYDAMDNAKPNKKRLTLKAADEVNNWLQQKDDDEEDQIIFKINHYQIIRRKRELTSNEKKEIKSLMLGLNNFYEGGSDLSILLEDKDTFDYYWSKMDSKAREDFKRSPIMALNKWSI